DACFGNPDGFGDVVHGSRVIALFADEQGRGAVNLSQTLRFVQCGQLKCSFSFQGRFSGFTQMKLCAWSGLEVPLRLATSGYFHRGRVRATFPSRLCEAAICLGATPFSTHSTSAVRKSH